MARKATTPESRDTLVVFTRYPEPGKTKTRLIPALGPEGAADLHCRMAEHAVARASDVAARSEITLQVRHESGDARSMAQWLGPEPNYAPQGPGDLGERMKLAFDDAFQAGAGRVVIIGTDCPGLTCDLLELAFERLKRNDIVLGPANDGGYYLIGLRRPVPELFGDIEWGAETVLEQTNAAASRLGYLVAHLAPLGDVDRPEDLLIWEAESVISAAPLAGVRIAVVIPALNEADAIAGALDSVEGAYNVDVIVADGGSTDGTADVARARGAAVIACERGRARQMNAGAESVVAEDAGDILLFLHADTRLPLGFAHHVRRTLAQPDTTAGAFELAIDAPGCALRVIERVANWRSRRQSPYGDQAVFLRAEVFREVGGFPDLPILEDYELVRRLRRRGHVRIAPADALTSARRWLRLGVIRTTLINWAVVVAYRLGVNSGRLARWYQGR